MLGDMRQVSVETADPRLSGPPDAVRRRQHETGYWTGIGRRLRRYQNSSLPR